MTKLRVIVLTLVAMSVAVLAQAAWTPAIQEPVVDLARVVSAPFEKAIGTALLRHQTQTGVQLAVLTVQSTKGEPIEDFSMRVATTWGGGSSKRDNGVLFVLAVKDRRMRLEVGYGLEAKLPDSRAKQIIDGTKRHLRAGDYDAAVAEVVSQIIAATGGTTTLQLPASRPKPSPPPPPTASSPDDGWPIGLIVMIVLGVVVFLFFFLMFPASGGGGSSDYSSSSWSSSSSSFSSGSSFSGGGGSFGGGGASSSW